MSCLHYRAVTRSSRIVSQDQLLLEMVHSSHSIENSHIINGAIMFDKLQQLRRQIEVMKDDEIESGSMYKQRAWWISTMLLLVVILGIGPPLIYNMNVVSSCFFLC